jgi:hypothetical protein
MFFPLQLLSGEPHNTLLIIDAKSGTAKQNSRATLAGIKKTEPPRTPRAPRKCKSLKPPMNANERR